MAELSNHVAEELFCRLVIQNKLADANTLKGVLDQREKWELPTFPEELTFRKVIQGAHCDKVRQAVEAKGHKFPFGFPSTSSSTTTEASVQETQTVTTQSEPQTTHSPTPTNSASTLIPTIPCNPKGPGQEIIQLLKQSRKLGASDLHICVGAPVVIRRRGKLERLKTPIFTAEKAEAVLFDILLEQQQTKLRKDLQLDFSLILDDGSRSRSNIVKERLGWSGCFHIIPDHIPSLEELGLPAIVKTMTEYPTGLVLVTGPSGSGKTTTLAAMVNLINSKRKDHIITVEDPIEFCHPSKSCQITQRSLGSHTQSFANALRGALRQDPDVIMIGELRDIETISIAITAAETGHLVLASLHTNSAEKTIDRLITSFPTEQQAQIRVMIADSIRGIICQQLLPKAQGDGVVMALEILGNNTSVRKMIVDNRTFQLDSVLQTSKKQGMIRMDDSIMELLDKGIISKETAKTYLRNPAALK